MRLYEAAALAGMLIACATASPAIHDGAGGNAGTAGAAGASPLAGTGGSGTPAGTGGGGAGGTPSGGGGAGGTPLGGGKSELPVPPTTGVPKPQGAPGGMKVLDWAGFQGAASYTFDDTNSSQIEHYAELQALGVHYTFYLITGKSEINDPVWPRAVEDGHELANHTQSHLQIGTGADVDAGQQTLEAMFGIKVWTMAAPMGDASYTPLAQTRYLINRGVNDTSIAPNDGSDPFSLPCWVPDQDAPTTAFNSKIDAAHSAHRWQVVLVHGFTGGSDGAYLPVALSDFTAGVTHAKAFGDLWIDSVVHVGAYWRAQKLLTNVAPIAAGLAPTWNWTLPEHFPPGQYLRVTVDGGTLRQGAVTLDWDDHGYYEVALDAGSLTLFP